MDDYEWNILVRTIEENNCILVLGPDIPLVKKKTSKSQFQQSKPLRQLLANEIAKKLKQNGKAFNRDSLRQIGQKFSLEKNQRALQIQTEEFYKAHEKQHCEIHTQLANLPFNFIINASHDNLLVHALKAQKKGFKIDYYNFRGPVRKMIDWEPKKEPLVYYLYGSVQKRESLVISETDLLEYLVAIISEAPKLPHNISSQFIDEKNSFLFLGFGFNNWYLKILLYVLQGGKDKKRRVGDSFAVEELVAEKDVDYANACFFFRNEYQILFPNLKLYDFVTELNTRYAAREEQTDDHDDEQAVYSRGSASIFISYASENKEDALSIFEQLKKEGYKPWLDQQELRGGDEWEAKISTMIKKVDYFLILESKELTKKVTAGRSYVSFEINEALESQKQILRGSDLAFIIPVKIDASKGLPLFDSKHRIDLSKKTGMNKLISTIKRDQQVRQL